VLGLKPLKDDQTFTNLLNYCKLPTYLKERQKKEDYLILAYIFLRTPVKTVSVPNAQTWIQLQLQQQQLPSSHLQSPAGGGNPYGPAPFVSPQPVQNITPIKSSNFARGNSGTDLNVSYNQNFLPSTNTPPLRHEPTSNQSSGGNTMSQGNYNYFGMKRNNDVQANKSSGSMGNLVENQLNAQAGATNSVNSGYHQASMPPGIFNVNTNSHNNNSNPTAIGMNSGAPVNNSS
jgi:hypothetical protein